MNPSFIYEKPIESMELLSRHICDLTSLLVILVLTTFALAGWGRFVVRWVGLPRATAISTLEIWLGFAIVVGIVELLHLIFPIDWRISLVLVMIGFAGFFAIDRSVESLEVRVLARFVRAHPWAVALLILVSLIWCSRAMSSPTNYDSGLYHFSAIRWLNEYPIVPGLGNLHGRLAYNQSYFSFVALMNIAPIWNKGYAAAGVFLLLLTAVTVLELGLHRLRGGVWVVVFLLISLGLYAKSLSSPTPDLAVVLLQVVIFLVLVKLVVDQEGPDKAIMLYGAVLFLLCFVIVTVKLSASMYALISIIIAWPMLAKGFIKNRMAAAKVLVICAVIGVTHVIRGYVLSGVPLYPSTFAGAWHLEWAMPIEAVQSEANWIYSWARRPGLPPEQVLGDWQWLGFWFEAIPASIVTLGFIILLSILLNLYLACRYRARCRTREPYVLYLPLVASVLFWFVTAPDWRFLGFIPGLLAIVSGWLVIRRLQEIGLGCLPSRLGLGKLLQGKLAISIVLVVLELARLKGVSLSGWQEIPSTLTQVKITDSGLYVHVPVTGDQCWNASLPCTPYFSAMLRGRWDNSGRPDLSSGFVFKVKNSNGPAKPAKS